VGVDLDLSRLPELQRVLGSSVPAIIGRLMTEIESATSQIDAALLAGDLDAAAHAAHSARNSALMIDARPLLDALGEIESSARTGDREGTGSGLERLRSVWPECQRALEDESARHR
jgi:HPt (histidine-containing phosphotransfer) domain-containing protein